jgi:Zn-dependent M16 (insulinase) family peptidase
MTVIHGFELIREQEIGELRTKAQLFRHVGTKGELLSLINEDENKVFGITFRTPPSDSTGVPHILEHAVLCGSRKYPVKEPFVELLKGSLNTFLNAMTYPDKTCYPVASQNVKDFYNLIDVYLDAVFYPRLTPAVLHQEGWHFELEPDNLLTIKGVVFNEMKGAYSSPDHLLAEYSQRSLFPDVTYGLDSGGDPEEIPNLTFEQFKTFHETYYHPSNARIYFYGDDDPEMRLRIANEYLKDFGWMPVDSEIPLQKRFDRPKRIIRAFAGGKEEEAKGMFTLNWMLDETTHKELNFAFHMLEYILLGMPGSPLRKALMDSNYGEDIAGEGLASEIRQMYFSAGLKGMDPKNADQVENVILTTLTELVSQGIDRRTVEAAQNTIEFTLRENNTGNYPRGLVLMLRALTTWLYGRDPLALIAFEAPLKSVKKEISQKSSFFEELIDRYLLKNPHRTHLVLEPDPDLAKKEVASVRDRLAKARAVMSASDLGEIRLTAQKLKERQETPDPSEDLAKIPSLRLGDLSRVNKLIPLDCLLVKETKTLYHDLFTSGIAYLELGFNLHTLPQGFLSYVPLFGRGLLEMGTEEEDFVSLTLRISRKTGGIHPVFHTSVVKGSKTGTTWLFLRGKAMMAQMEELLAILRDVLLTVRLENQARFRQIVLEAKARLEQAIVPAGHQMVNLRLRAPFNEADWAAEQMKGVSYLLFLRELARRVEEDWSSVHQDLEKIRKILVNRNAMLINVTVDGKGWKQCQPQVQEFLEHLPASPVEMVPWNPDRKTDFECMTIPAQVNYVGKGTSLYARGYRFHGSAHVISRHLRNAWLWERIRVQGGAYGAFCLFDRLSGVLTFLSYRDPNLLGTLEAFDASGQYLKNLELSDDELKKAIIGTIGDIDQYQLPDAKGYTSMVRYLTGETDAERQRMREDVLGTTIKDFRSFGELLEGAAETSLVKVLGSQTAADEVEGKRPGWLKVFPVL